MRRAAKVDGNQTAIVNALRQLGCGVLDLSAVGKGCPDLLVHCPTYPFQTRLMEVKNLSGRGNKLTPAQQVFHANWRGAVVVVETVDQALAAIKGTG